MLFLIAIQEIAQQNPSFNINPESIFGGAVLLAFFYLLLSGKLRTEREINREKDIVNAQQDTIDQQRRTIKALTDKERETLHLLRELRSAAIAKGDIQFSAPPPYYSEGDDDEL